MDIWVVKDQKGKEVLRTLSNPEAEARAVRDHLQVWCVFCKVTDVYLVDDYAEMEE